MAWITGGMLLLLCLEMVLKYVFHAGGVQADGRPASVLGAWVAMTHGVVYVFYLLAAFDLWSRIRWGLGRIALLIVAGLVPFLSIIMEAFAHRWFHIEANRDELVGGDADDSPGDNRGGDGGGDGPGGDGFAGDSRGDSAPVIG